jgi:DNA modification methylase
MIPIHELKDHPKNRNKHSDEQIERLAKLYEYHGIRHPIIISELSGCIVAGHGRKLAGKKAGFDSMPVVYQKFADETAEYAFIQADNAIASWAELDLAGINADLPDLGPDFDLEMLGLKDFTLDLSEKLEPECDEDEVPDARPDPKVVQGEVYILGNHRLMCGDSTAITDIERLMNGEKADMVFTDPPYGMNLDTDYSKMGKSGLKHKRVIGDGDDFKAELIQTLLGIFQDCEEIFLFGADYYAELIHEKNNGSWIVWDKRSRSEIEVGTLDGAFGSDFETCWSKKKRKRELARVLRQTGAFSARGEDRSVHPTQKPVALVEWFFERAKGSNIVDVFGGSGSTLIACEKTGRNCFMMELDPHYCGVILDRWQKFTGKKAHREDGVAWDEIRGA